MVMGCDEKDKENESGEDLIEKKYQGTFKRGLGSYIVLTNNRYLRYSSQLAKDNNEPNYNYKARSEGEGIYYIAPNIDNIERKYAYFTDPDTLIVINILRNLTIEGEYEYKRITD